MIKMFNNFKKLTLPLLGLIIVKYFPLTNSTYFSPPNLILSYSCSGSSKRRRGQDQSRF